ncbi:MAG: DUF1989 domain-containing protein [Solirubrobacterales bacterium]|nr:DUF1989 domain-containing protein [Solirubrobacterales bacterium]
MALTDATVASGTGLGFDLAAGETVRISTPGGEQGGDFSFLGFDQAMTRNVNGWKRFGRPWLVFSADPGMVLCDGEGEAVMEVGPCRCDGRNDIMYPGCWSEIYGDGRPGCRDLIADGLGIERAEISGMLSFFVNAEIDTTAYRGLGRVDIEPGDHITLRALRDVRAAVSACPDMEIPGWTPGDLRVEVTSLRDRMSNDQGEDQ